MITKDDCKRILSRVGITLGVSPSLISTRLLGPSDKREMLSGDITYDVLLVAVKLWMDAGMPDYANGCTKRMKNNRMVNF
jgi:hypothetical protein